MDVKINFIEPLLKFVERIQFIYKLPEYVAKIKQEYDPNLNDTMDNRQKVD